MIPLDTVHGIPMVHWLLLAGAGWLLMFACFVGWHTQPDSRLRDQHVTAQAMDVLAEPTVETPRRAA